MAIQWSNIPETGEGSSVDPFCRPVRKESRPEGPVTWYETDSGEKWAFVGVCNQCGLCEEFKPEFVGTVQEVNFLVSTKEGAHGDIFVRRLQWNHAPGTPNAVEELNYSERPDIPIRPSLLEDIPQCSYKLWVDTE